MTVENYKVFVKKFQKSFHAQFYDVYRNEFDDIERAKELLSGFSSYIDITEEIPRCCDRKIYKTGNRHHYDPPYIQEKVLPIFLSTLNIDVDLSAFVESKLYDVVPMYELTTDAMFSYRDLSSKNEIIGNHETVLRNVLEENEDKHFYHNLFRGSHTCCLIKNLSINSSRKLLLNCDSMFVPIVPILSYFFKEILHLDNRTDRSFWNIIKNYDASDYICALTTSNVFNEKFLTNLK